MQPSRRFPFGLLVGAGIIIYLATQLVQTVKHNYDLKRHITELEQKVADLDQQNAELKYQIQYYQTDSFKEKEARAKLGLQQPGENVIILPKDQPKTATDQKPAAPRKSNFKQWIEFLFG